MRLLLAKACSRICMLRGNAPRTAAAVRTSANAFGDRLVMSLMCVGAILTGGEVDAKRHGFGGTPE